MKNAPAEATSLQVVRFMYLPRLALGGIARIGENAKAIRSNKYITPAGDFSREKFCLLQNPVSISCRTSPLRDF